jgi:hypothetical protein
MTARTPDWLVERLHAGDLPPDEAARVRAQLEAEGGLGRLDALRASDAAFREAHPPGPALGEIRRRAGVLGLARAAATRRRLVPALAAVAAVALAVVLVPHRLDRGGTRTKGGAPHLELHRQLRGGEAEALSAGAAVRSGDLLQLSYVAAGAAYGVVVSVDGRGAVTLHLPEGGGRAVALRRGGAVALAHAYQLDDAPGFERFFLVTGRAPFDAALVLDAARRIAALGSAETAPLDLPPGLAQQAMMLRKR